MKMTNNKDLPRITIDGPAASGKGSVAVDVATSLGISHISTGSVFRALALLFTQAGHSAEDVSESLLNALVDDSGLSLRFEPGDVSAHVIAHGEDISTSLYTPEVSEVVPVLAAMPVVQKFVVQFLHTYTSQVGLVLEGRNAGNSFMPDAELKVYLTATLEERARRRYEQYREHGEEDLTLQEVIERIRLRDKKDIEREVDPLVIPEGAVVIDTTMMAIEEVSQRICDLYQQATIYS